jgi:hypothetical protein
VTAARIAAVTRRHARGRALTDAEQTATLTELAEVADGRVDLLAQPICLQIAQLCIQADADTALIGLWIAEGRPAPD